MSQPPVVISYNALPEAARHRLAESLNGRALPAAHLRAPAGPGAGKMIVLALVAGVVAWWLFFRGHGEPGADGDILGGGALAVLAACGFVGLAVIFWLVRRAVQDKRMPFKPGVYVVGTDLIEARGDLLRIRPIASVVRIQLRNENQAISLVFHFSDTSIAFPVPSVGAAQAALSAIQIDCDRLADAVRAADVNTIAALDPLFAARVDAVWEHQPKRAPAPTSGPATRPVPRALAQPMMIGVVAALVLTPPSWYLRNLTSDNAMYERASRPGASSYLLDAYLERGTRHTDEAHALRFERRLDEAIQVGSVTSIRDYLTQHPDAPKKVKARAAAAIHDHFVDAIAKFHARATGADPDVIRFMEQLLTYQETHGSPTVKVRFRPPHVEDLAKTDTLFAKLAKAERIDIAPIAPHFATDRVIGFEKLITDGLSKGISGVFPHDIVQLAEGERLDADATIDTSAPVIEVAYELHPLFKNGAPSLYSRKLKPGETLTGPERVYIGLQVAFLVKLHVPDTTKPHEIAFAVRPPPLFSVDSYSASYLSTLPADASVYSVMAAKAFAELAEKLDAAFFAGAGKAEDKAGDKAEDETGGRAE